MLRERRRNGSVVIYRVFLAAMIAAVVLFLMRVACLLYTSDAADE